MDSGDLKRRLVSPEQLNTLLEFMRAHPELAKGLSRGRRGKLMTVKVWNACAQKLNSMQDGAVKDGKGWSKYWCDWKYRVRRHALEIRVAQDTNQVPPEGITAMSSIEETILSIIGGGSLNRVVIKTDMDDEESNEEDQEASDNDTTKINVQQNETPTIGVKRPQPSTTGATSDHDDNQEEEEEDRDEDAGSPSAKMPRTAIESETDDEEDNTTKFLRLEKMQLENAKRIQASICQMSLEICKLSDIMGEIRDVLTTGCLSCRHPQLSRGTTAVYQKN